MKALLDQPIVQEAARILSNDRVRLVGGAVRDSLAGFHIADLDMATQVLPDEVLRLMKVAGHTVIPTGLEHGTVTLVIDKVPLEITTLRRDVATDGRRATVAFTQDWQEDAARRDFTFNSLSLNMDGVISDYFGGQEDLNAGRIRFVGDARTRIHEDHLRLLRFFRFYARFGKIEPDEDLKQILSAEASSLHKLSGERLQKETFSLLPLAKAHKALDLMKQLGVDKHLFGSAINLEKFTALAARELKHDAPNSVRRLSALMDKDADKLEHIAQRFKLSNTDKDRLQAIFASRVYDSLNEQLYRSGRTKTRDALLLADSFDEDAFAQACKWQHPQFPINGQDLIQCGFEPGTILGSALKKLENLWIVSDFKLGKQELMDSL